MHLTGSDIRQEAEALDLQLCTPQERALTSRLFFFIIICSCFHENLRGLDFIPNREQKYL